MTLDIVANTKFPRELTLEVIANLAHKEDPCAAIKQLALLAQISKEWNHFIKNDSKIEMQILKPMFEKCVEQQSIPKGMRVNWRAFCKAYVKKTLGQSISFKREEIDLPTLKDEPKIYKCQCNDPRQGQGYREGWLFPVGNENHNFLINAKDKIVHKFPFNCDNFKSIDANEKQIIVGFHDGKIKSYDSLTGAEQWTCDAGSYVVHLHIYQDTLYSVSNGEPKAWDIANGKAKPDTSLEGLSTSYLVRGGNHLVFLKSPNSLGVRDINTGLDRKIIFSPGSDGDTSYSEVNVTDRYLVVYFVCKNLEGDGYLSHLRIYDLTLKDTNLISQQIFAPGTSTSGVKIQGDFVYMVCGLNSSDPGPDVECYLNIVNLKSKSSCNLPLSKEDISIVAPSHPMIPFYADVTRQIDDEPAKIIFNLYKDKKIISHKYSFVDSDDLFVKKDSLIDESHTSTLAILMEKVGLVFRRCLEVTLAVLNVIRSFIWRHKRVLLLTGLALTSLAVANTYLRR